jgi:tight adherence protein B
MRLFRKSQVEERLETFADVEALKPPEEFVKEDRGSFLTEQLNKAVAGRGFAANIAIELARADLKITVGEYLALLVIAVILGGALGLFIFRNPVFALAGAVGGFFAPRVYIGFAQGQRLTKFNNQLGDTLNLMVNGLRAGYSVLQAMEAVSREMPSPMSTEFGRVVQEVQLGLTVEQALDNMLRRVTSEDLDMVVTAINVQREVGGNLGEILEVISHTIRERVRIKGEVKTLTAQGMMTGYVISGVPIALFLLIFLINRPYAVRLFEFPCGVGMLVCGIVLIVSGFFAMMKIVQIEV